MPLPKQIESKIQHTQTGCWVWSGSLRGGYGKIRYKGVSCTAHRLVYELLVGPIPPDLQLDHLCRNRSCVNPVHLEAVTHRENSQRAHIIDLHGQRFGRLLVKELRGFQTGLGMTWLCVCDCGNDTVVNSRLLRIGKTKSCGCLRKEVAANQGRRNAKFA